MSELKDLLQGGDWKAEKHVPVIEVPPVIKKGEFFRVLATVGKDMAHPNKTEHHISWIAVYFRPDGEKFPYEIARTQFSAHGAAATGADTSGVYTHHETVLSFKTDKSGTVYAESFCNIHGLWQNAVDIKVV